MGRLRWRIAQSISINSTRRLPIKCKSFRSKNNVSRFAAQGFEDRIMLMCVSVWRQFEYSLQLLKQLVPTSMIQSHHDHKEVETHA